MANECDAPWFLRLALAEMLERTPEARDPSDPNMTPNHALGAAILRAPGPLNCEALRLALSIEEDFKGSALLDELWNQWFLGWPDCDDPGLWLRVAADIAPPPRFARVA